MADINITQKRINWVDFAKGVAIILMITAHSIGGVPRGLIYTFHMPLFFILSCVTYKYSTTKDELWMKTKKAFRHLIVPALIMMLLKIAVVGVMNYQQFLEQGGVVAFIVKNAEAVFWASGMPLSVGKHTVAAVGLPWFLVALFIGRTLFDLLQMVLMPVVLTAVCIVLCLLGMFLGQYQWLPWSLDIVLAMMPAYLAGKYIWKIRVNKKPVYKFAGLFVLWIAGSGLVMGVTNDYLELAFRRYPLYPVSILLAIIGTYMVAELSAIVADMKIAVPVNYLGRYSIYMLFVHNMDYLFFEKLWSWSDRGYIALPCRLAVDIIIFAIVMIIYSLIKHRRTE